MGVNIGIIDYGMGNILSVYNAFDYIGSHVTVCQSADQIFHVDKIVLPGVGAFQNCYKNLKETGFIDALNEMVMVKKKPILGICLGLQVMARRSYEGGEFSGLGWFEADVVKINPVNSSFHVPHVGWNEVSFRSDSPLFKNMPEKPALYFVHSYYIKCDSDTYTDAVFDHGGTFTAAIRKNNIAATQFHPEKSQDLGLRILENFLDWDPV
jgi:glutamine amidotransferase